jgi:hypothetical protein
MFWSWLFVIFGGGGELSATSGISIEGTEFGVTLSRGC